MIFGVEYFMDGLFEIFRLGMIDVHKSLRIAVDDGKPGALDLYHDAVPFFETVAFVSNVVADFCYFSRNKGFGIGEAAAVFAAKYVCAHQHLEMSHPNILRIGNVIRSVTGIDIDELDHPIRIGPVGGNEKIGDDRTGNGDIFRERRGFKHQNIGP